MDSEVNVPTFQVLEDTCLGQDPNTFPDAMTSDTLAIVLVRRNERRLFWRRVAFRGECSPPYNLRSAARSVRANTTIMNDLRDVMRRERAIEFEFWLRPWEGETAAMLRDVGRAVPPGRAGGVVVDHARGPRAVRPGPSSLRHDRSLRGPSAQEADCPPLLSPPLPYPPGRMPGFGATAWCITPLATYLSARGMSLASAAPPEAQYASRPPHARRHPSAEAAATL
jgi:hypothetical protein